MIEHPSSVPVPPARDLQLPVQLSDAASCSDAMLSAGRLMSCKGLSFTFGCHVLEVALQHAGTSWGQRPPAQDMPASFQSPVPGNGPSSVPPPRHMHHGEWGQQWNRKSHDTTAGCVHL